jgi:DNA-binding CsgD family transcriptional regulator
LHGTLSLTTALIEAQQGRSDIAREHLIAGLDVVIERGVVADGLFGLEVAAEWFGTVGLHGDAVATWDSAHRLRHSSGLTAPPAGRTWVDRGQARDRRRIRSHQRRAALDDVVALSLDGALHRARKLAAEARSVTRVDSTRADREARRFHPTPREAEVLGWLVDGFSDREIAERLFISPKTVSVHISNLKGKLEASSRIELAMTAIRQGWARPSSDLGAPTLPDLI